MGLEAGPAAVTHDRASRLHPAIILSSEQHATDPYCTTRRRPRHIFFFVAPKYFQCLRRREKPGKSAGGSIIC
jgi:hypothetical protein